MRVISAIIFLLASVLTVGASEVHAVRVGTCTGFHVEGNYIVTAGHCVKGLEEPLLVRGSNWSVIAEVVVHEDPTKGGMDFAILESVNPLARTLGPMTLLCEEVPPTGTRIHISGFPGGVGFVHLHGEIISGERPDPPLWEKPVYWIQAQVMGGFSGSPVTNDEGSVVGIVVGNLFPSAFGMVQPIKPVCEALNALRIS